MGINGSYVMLDITSVIRRTSTTRLHHPCISKKPDEIE
jgi:hypothetical protein